VSNVIDFLERFGRDADLRRATPEQMERALSGAGIDPELRAAILGKDPQALSALLGAPPVVCCLIHKEEEEEGEEEEEEEEDEDDEDEDEDEKDSR
jgi:hypothetical protein